MNRLQKWRITSPLIQLKIINYQIVSDSNIKKTGMIFGKKEPKSNQITRKALI